MNREIIVIGLIFGVMLIPGCIQTNEIPEQKPTIQTDEIPEQKPTTLPDNFKYPYILEPLSQDQLSSLRSEFEASNKNICAQINEYGFTEFKKYCFDEIVRIEIKNETSIVEAVKNWLVQNSKFTGVTDKSDVIVDRVRGLEGCIKCETQNLDTKVIGLSIRFRGQTYKELPIEGDISPLIVFANANGISRINGHWFPKITVPLKPKISEVSAKNKLNGRTFTHYTLAGKPVNYKVGQRDLSNAAHKVVFVKKSSQGLEFRLAWKIPVGEELPWIVYIDAITGEELKVVQMFWT